MSPVTEFANRQYPDTVVLFDVDGTLTPARNVSSKPKNQQQQQQQPRLTIFSSS